MDSIQKYLDQLNRLHTLVAVTGGVQQAAALVEQEHPELLLLEGQHFSTLELNMLSHITSDFPNMGVFMLCPSQSPEFFIEAMQAGVREVLLTPLTDNFLIKSIERFHAKINQAHEPVSQSKVLAFISCKGGSGATFLATNIAYTLAALEHSRVVLFDFNLQFGDALLFVHDGQPKTSITDVTRQIQRLDGSFLATSLIQVLPNFGLLPAPDKPEEAAEMRSEHVEPLLQVARNNYDFVILDVGRVLNAVSIQALDQADLIFPVLQQSVPSIRGAKHLTNTLSSLGYLNDKIPLIVNRYDKKNDITLADVASTLKLEVFKTVPNDYDIVAESVNHGTPVTKLAPHSAVAKSLQEIAHALAVGAEGAEGTASTGLFGKWFSS